jgi:outer membrane protein assembly factor BamE (lipoprotein component of BamABCDE complex)
VKPLRRWSIRIVLSLGGLVLIVAALSFWWSFRDTTVYASGFTEEAFKRLKPGMKIEGVYALLGPPLDSRPEDSRERWCYDEQPLTRRDGAYALRDALSSPNCVVFDEAKRVLAVTGDELGSIRKGMAAEEVLELVGEPHRRVPAASLTLHYSRPGGDGLFRGRIVAVSRDRRVSDVISYQFYD